MRTLCPLTYFKADDKIEFSLSSLALYRDVPNFTTEEEVIFGTIDAENLKKLPGLSVVVDPAKVGASAIAKQMVATPREVQLFLLALWFVKDNSVNSPNTFVTMDGNAEFHRNTNVFVNSNAKGKFSTEAFSAEELNQVKVFYATIKKTTEGTLPGMGGFIDYVTETCIASPSPFNEMEYGKHSIVTRGLVFLRAARQSSFTPAKISNYIAAVECLFSPNPLDFKHRVSELAALYVAGDYETKRDTYDTISHGYDVRSKYVHGHKSLTDDKKNSLKTLENLSTGLDAAVRKVFTKVVSDQAEFDGRDRSEFFKTLTFAGKQQYF